jgi:hypothetical protein
MVSDQREEKQIDLYYCSDLLPNLRWTSEFEKKISRIKNTLNESNSRLYTTKIIIQKRLVKSYTLQKELPGYTGRKKWRLY